MLVFFPVYITNLKKRRIYAIVLSVKNMIAIKQIDCKKDNIEPWQDDKGILYIGIEQFLLEEDWLR